MSAIKSAALLLRRKRDRRAGGFTLLEVTAIAIMLGILAALATPSFIGLLNRQRLNAVQEQVLQGLRDAQSEARRRQEPYQFSLTATTVGGEEFLAFAITPVASNSSTACIPTSLPLQTLASTGVVEIDDTNTTLGPTNGGSAICGTAEVRQQFNSKGELRDAASGSQTGRLTLQLAGSPDVKRCVIASTILGALRTAKGDDCL